MTILPIVIVPERVLKQKSSPVETVDSNVQKLMSDMLETMYYGQGIGLAAVQVGALSRVIVLDLQQDDDGQRPTNFYPLFMANPEILEKSSETCSALEGCLSVPGQQISITRSLYIKVRFIDYNNNQKDMEAHGWLARAIQHEIDHLDGISIIDYVSPLKRDMALRKIQKNKQNLM